MNKKFLSFMMLALIGVGLVSAFGYYAIFSTSFEVLPSVTLEGDLAQDLGSVYDGTVLGTAITITNDAPSDRTFTISNDAVDGEIEVSYTGTLSMTKKDTTTWQPVGSPMDIGYTVVGETFEVTGVPEGYTAIYYKDGVVGLSGRIDNPQPAISIVGAGNLPHADDANVDPSADYTQEPDNYNLARGAKIWVVPTADLNAGELTWANMANYYYETDLIQYNSDGELTLSSGASVTITPVYEIAVGVTGEQTVTTTVA